MGERDTVDVILIVLYVSGAVLLMVAAYLIYLRRYVKRGKMKILNDVILHTSRYDRYNTATQFLLELPQNSEVEFSLLDENEKFLVTILKANMEAGEHVIPFDPANYKDGIYFLFLKTDNATVLRKISVDRTPVAQ